MTNQQTLPNQLLSFQNLVNLKEASTPLQKPSNITHPVINYETIPQDANSN